MGRLRGYDVVGPSPEAPKGVKEVARSAYEAARMEHGFPVHGAELDERTIPAEAGLVEACVSFTKGCYTGQELVARIDSHGSNVPRHLRGLLLSGPAAAGASLTAEQGGGKEGEAKEVGRVTSVAFRRASAGWRSATWAGPWQWGQGWSWAPRRVHRALAAGPGAGEPGAGGPGAGGGHAVEALVASLPLQV